MALEAKDARNFNLSFMISWSSFLNFSSDIISLGENFLDNNASISSNQQTVLGDLEGWNTLLINSIPKYC